MVLVVEGRVATTVRFWKRSYRGLSNYTSHGPGFLVALHFQVPKICLNMMSVGFKLYVHVCIYIYDTAHVKQCYCICVHIHIYIDRYRYRIGTEIDLHMDVQ